MLVGRSTEVAKLQALFATVRLVTLHGPPGIGKTAIAHAFSETLRARGGVLYCDLVCAKSYEDVCFVLAGALDVSLGGGKDLGRVLGAALEGSKKIVVLDGGELAPDAVARLVGELPDDVRVLVVSREILRVEGEAALPIGPLADDDAFTVFVEGAKRARVGFDETTHVTAIRELVTALSGVPLALVLAASRITVMDVPSLLERISEKLDWLSAKRRGAPDRHASLRSAFESSIATLAEEERVALSECTVFHGPFSLDAAENVLRSEHAADVLQSLVEKSLLQRSDEEAHGIRFSMLEILRRLTTDADPSEPNQARDLHAAYFAKVGSTWDDASWYGGVVDLPRLLAMRDNLLGAHVHAASQPVATADVLRTLVALYPIHAALGPYDAFLALLDEERDSRIAESADAALASRFFLVRGRALQLGAMREEAAKAFETSLLYARKSAAPKLAARALSYLALARRTQGSLAEARERFEAAIALFRDAGDKKSEAVVLSGLASLDLAEGDLDGAKRALEAAIDVLILGGDPATAAMMRVDLGIVLQEMGDLEGARGVYEAALAVHRSAGNQRHEAITLGYLGTLEDEQGRVSPAEVALAAALAPLRTMGDSKFVAVFAACIAAVRAERDDASGAQAALAEAERAAQGAEPRIVATVALHRLRVEQLAVPNDAAVVERRGAAIGLLQQSDDVRFAARMLDRILVPAATPSATRARALRVAEDASWLELPGGKFIDLKRRAVHKRLVERLVRERLASPSVPVSVADLVAAGWPGEKLTESSAQNRLHVALATLRADGLRDHLKRDPHGYMLDPSVEVRVERI